MTLARVALPGELTLASPQPVPGQAVEAPNIRGGQGGGERADASVRPRLALVTRGLQRISTLAGLLPDWQLAPVSRWPLVTSPAPASAVLAWGLKPSAEVAQRYAEHHGLPVLRAEDGFLRSVGLGDRDPPLSLVLDDLGIYYDASAPSRLEALIAAGCATPDEALRADALRAAWVAARVSKYNHVRAGLPAGLPMGSADAAPVLVIDQTAGDASIRGAHAGPAQFHRMLEAALDEHPGAPVWLKVHPDVVAGRKRGHFSSLSAGAAQRVTLIAGDVHAPDLLEACAASYVVSSQVGFEALLWGRTVRCFGLPFYAGWGLTRDEQAAPARRHGRARLADLTHAALVAYPRYLDPETGQLGTPERLIAHIALQRACRARLPDQVQVLGFSRWKRPIAQAFLQGATVTPVRTPRQASADVVTAVWGRKPLPPQQRAPSLRIEDGFIRSVGLGADLTRPLSWVVDDRGIYFDATVPSRLEHILRHTEFDAPLLQRAAALREAIVAARITKYNVGQGRWTRPAAATRVVLVPGQVESDASIAWGAAGLKTNLALLQAARAAEPAAWVLYKPHPDVLAGLRGSPREAAALLDACRAHCDEVVTEVPMGELLDQVDAVHTLTSLTGFEALMRGRQVVTWGVPFYAGWGLTDDRADPGHPAWARRGRSLGLDALVAATLILYPTYVSRVSGAYTTPEQALAELTRWQRDGRMDRAGGVWRTMRRAVLQAAARLRGR